MRFFNQRHQLMSQCVHDPVQPHPFTLELSARSLELRHQPIKFNLSRTQDRSRRRLENQRSLAFPFQRDSRHRSRIDFIRRTSRHG